MDHEFAELLIDSHFFNFWVLVLKDLLKLEHANEGENWIMYSVIESENNLSWKGLAEVIRSKLQLIAGWTRPGCLRTFLVKPWTPLRFHYRLNHLLECFTTLTVIFFSPLIILSQVLTCVYYLSSYHYVLWRRRVSLHFFIYSH